MSEAINAATDMDECQKSMFVRMQAAEARALAATAESDRLRRALEDIASQKTVSELCAEFGEDYEGDWQDGYEHCVACARTALATYRTDKEQDHAG